MLDAIRRGSTGWVAKILLAVLVFSFAIWGVADVFTGWGRGSIAKVGDREIRVNDFQRAFQNELRTIQNRSGRRISTEDARAAGLDDRILSQLMAWAAVGEHAGELNLALSDAELLEALKKDPAFAGPDGSFSRIGFENTLYQSGLTDRAYLSLRRDDELRRQVTDALTKSIVIPETMIDVANAWQGETRQVEYFTIDADKVITVPEPDEAQIKETYEKDKSKFMAPEYRKLAVLVLSPDDLKKQMDVSEEEITTSYEDTKERYNTPERRRVQQIPFKDKAAAAAAKKAIAEGKSFGTIAKESGAKTTDIDLGQVKKSDLIDPTIAEAAFALEKDSVSDVVEGRFATVLLRVTDIQPAVLRTFDEVKDQVRDNLAKQKANAKMQDLHDEIEDNRGAGKTLKEIAEVLNLKYYDVSATDSLNKDKEDKQAIPLQDVRGIMKIAFESQVGLENESVELADGNYAWVDVIDITAEKLKPFDDVKDEAKKLTIDNERARKLNDLAATLVDKANNGEALAALASEAGEPKVETTQPFTRKTEPQGFTKNAVKQVFALPLGKTGSTTSVHGNSRTVFKLTNIAAAKPPTEQQRETINREITNEITNDVLGEYVAALQTRLGATINQQEYRRATGADAEQ
jgi:peptidyl-prolyl cis-trans isomerase D